MTQDRKGLALAKAHTLSASEISWCCWMSAVSGELLQFTVLRYLHTRKEKHHG